MRWTLLSLLVFPTVAVAQVPLGGEFLVNTFTTGVQYKRLQHGVASDADGDFVVVWDSSGQDGNLNGIFGQRFASNGIPAGTEFQVNTTTTGHQQRGAVTTDDDGDFVVTWHDTNLQHAFAQRFASNGGLLGTEFQVSTTNVTSSIGARVDSDADGDFVVVYVAGSEARGRRFDSGGTALGTEFTVVAASVNSSVALDEDGDFSVVWAIGSAVAARRYDSGGSPQGGEFQINSYTSGGASFPFVAAAPNGDFVVVWATIGPGADVLGQRFASSGTPIGSEFAVNTYTTYGQVLPHVDMRADGGFTVVWQSYGQDNPPQGVSTKGCFGQVFDSTGAVVGAEFQVNTYTTGWQDACAVGVEDNGDFVVAWRNVEMSYDTFARRYSVNSPTPTSTDTPPATSTASTTVTATSTATPTVTATATSTASVTITSTPGGDAVCAITPMGSCATPAKALVKIKNTGTVAQNQVIWKWLKGTTTKADFGTPTAATSYALCIYADGALLTDTLIPQGSNWTDLTPGFKYKSSSGTPEGVFKTLLKEGAGKAKVLVKGKGAGLVVPALPLGAGSVRVQLVKDPASGSECWESTFTGGFSDGNTIFKARTP